MRVNPAVQPGRWVLRKVDNTYKPDYIWKALLTVSGKNLTHAFHQTVKEEGVLLWASNNRRVKPEDRWVNCCYTHTKD